MPRFLATIRYPTPPLSFRTPKAGLAKKLPGKGEMKNSLIYNLIPWSAQKQFGDEENPESSERSSPPSDCRRLAGRWSCASVITRRVGFRSKVGDRNAIVARGQHAQDGQGDVVGQEADRAVGEQ